MANRPVFIPIINKQFPGVIIQDIEFKWFPGMSKSQKQKSIKSLHESANEQNINPILEISSKSEVKLGVKLSAFNLMITTKKQKRSFSIETAFQSSKVFDKGGPYTDLLGGTSREAKKDIRLKESGNLKKFIFFNTEFPVKPRTFFYDWLYINALNQNKELSDKIISYQGFTDIEFNPKKSLNCQAYSAALYVSMEKMGILQNALISPKEFQHILSNEYKVQDNSLVIQESLI
ncbi:MAG: hypothetical protein GY828_06325 [Candidatus Gracilibacteria bacterium]|nr:hypothetical protein [Candidatus Gracilibacteria bacterium]